MITILDEVSEYWKPFLELEAEASHGYNAFAFSDGSEAKAVREILVTTGNAEFSPPASRIAMEGGRCIGAMAFLSGSELRRRRLAGARALSRAAPLIMSESLKRRLGLASRTLFNPLPTDNYLSRMAVSPESRRRGIGSLLVQYFIEESERQRFQRCVLLVDATNQPAISLYAKHGFSVIDRRSVYDSGRDLRLEHLVMGYHLREPGGCDVHRQEEL